MDTRRGAADQMDEASSEDLGADAAVFRVTPLPRGRGSGVAGQAGIAVGVAVAAFALIGAFDPKPPASMAAAMPLPTTGERVLLSVNAEQTERQVFIHGDVFVRRATTILVFVFMADGRDRRVTMQSVDLPGADPAVRLDLSDRFALTFDLDGATAMQPTLVTAWAYDDAGKLLARAQTRFGAFAPEAPAAYRM